MVSLNYIALLNDEYSLLWEKWVKRKPEKNKKRLIWLLMFFNDNISQSPRGKSNWSLLENSSGPAAPGSVSGFYPGSKWGYGGKERGWSESSWIQIYFQFIMIFFLSENTEIYCFAPFSGILQGSLNSKVLLFKKYISELHWTSFKLM